ncbi:MAG: DUF5134 domain-containing protein [Sporichthyaceae bacterium]
MHDHHHGGGTGLNLLPVWGAMFWVPLLAAVCALHLVHCLSMPRGQGRRFHLVHLAMGVGMVYMFAPWPSPPVPMQWWVAAYTALGLAIACFVGLEWQRGRRVNALWILAAGECAAMAYMFDVHRGAGEIPALSRVLVGAYLVLAAAWTHGWLVETIANRRRSGVPYDVGPGTVPARQLFCSGRWDVAAAEAAMCVAMAYMFLGMDSGSGEFFAKAFQSGAVTEETLWALSLAALAVLALVPARRHQSTATAETPQGYTMAGTRAGGGS